HRVHLQLGTYLADQFALALGAARLLVGLEKLFDLAMIGGEQLRRVQGFVGLGHGTLLVVGLKEKGGRGAAVPTAKLAASRSRTACRKGERPHLMSRPKPEIT